MKKFFDWLFGFPVWVALLVVLGPVALYWACRATFTDDFDDDKEKVHIMIIVSWAIWFFAVLTYAFFHIPVWFAP